ncbi:MAG: hydantoinase B/oxoprolinase family protein [Dongiaceae bacterium]
MSIDVVTLNVLTNAFHAIAEEMGVNLLRAARSTIIREARDCSCALLDAEGRIIAEAEHIPVQMSSLSLPIRACLKKYGGRIGPNEIFITNDPYIGGQHLQDITIFTPIFHGGTLIGFSGSIAHHIDIGGGAAGLTFDAREFYEEGLRFTAMKFNQRRDLAPGGSFYDIVHANFRAPETTWGDLQAQLAANEVGRRRILELVQRYGAGEVRRYMAATMDYSERMMRAAIAGVPDGRYEAEDAIDDGVFGDEPIVIRVALTVAGDSIEVDFAGTAPQVEEFLNVPIGSTYSSTYSCLKMALTSGAEPIPANDGCYRPIEIKVPYRSILNPAPPAAVRARMCGAYRLFDAVLMALQKAMPDRVAAPGFHANTTSGVSQFKDGRFSIFIEDIGGGWGGNPEGDGADMLDAPLSNCLITPTEAVELDHPFLLLRRYELLADSGGPGRHRGGLGSVREYEVLEDGAEYFGYSDRHRFAPPGAAGGEPGSRGAFLVLRGNEEIILPSKTRFKLRRGDVVRVVAGGGGGFGPPGDRDVAAVLADLADGKVTPQHVALHYPQAASRAGA